jgi:hypothetical protein
MSSKYWSKKVDTTTNKESWQESFPRETTISPRAIQALDVLLNFSGSWAAAFSDSYATFRSDATTKDADDVPQNPRWRVSKLGYDGFPELNFVPYNYRTNAFGSKGGSLIGHPISFSVVGPTLKSVNYEWEWSVDGANNKLTLSNTTRTLTEIYGDLALGISEVPLFLTISETGAVRTSGGVGENLEDLITTASNGLYPVEEYGASANFEIFRVIDVNTATGEISLDPNKPLSKYFTIPDSPVVKGVMMFRPYVTRLAAVPESGNKGAEKTFMVVSPEKSAFNDLHEPAFIQTEPSLARYASAVQSGYSLPIPLPLKTLKGTLESTDQNATKADGAGVFRIHNLPTGHGLTGGEIIHITEAVCFKTNDTELFETKELLGWFEVIENAGADGIQVRREIEANPYDGSTNFGENLFLDKTSLAATAQVNLSFTVHEKVSELFLGDYNPDKVEACRLKNLIDPAWVDRTTKQVSNDTAGTLFGGSAARADRAIFTTNTDGASYADAGSMLDLGFRMVLFPAKDFGGNAVPDYNNPITSLETVIDPTSNEKQTISIDYSAGTVTLSHPPTRGGTIAPSGIIGEAGNNPRGEVVLFAACVPFSMEEGQTGVGVSITGGELATADHGKEFLNFKSVLGDKVHAEIHNISAGIVRLFTRSFLPPRGRLTLVPKETSDPKLLEEWSTRHGNPFLEPLGEFGYKSITLLETTNDRHGVRYTYSIDINNLFSNNKGILNAAAHDFVLRKSNPNFTSFNDDSFYGSAWRSDSIRFAYADLTANVDGSITVMPTAVAGPAQELRGLFPLGSDLELGRVAFNRDSQRWVVSSAPYEADPETHQIGLEVSRGKTFISDSNTGTISSPTQLMTLITEINPTSGSDFVSFIIDPNLPTDVKNNIALLSETLPSSFLNTYKIKALVEAQTVCSKIIDWTSQTYDNNRLVVALRKFKGDDEHIEAVGNPIHWVSVPIPSGQSLSDTVNAINVETVTEFESYLASKSDDERLALTDRYVDVLPSQPYISSQNINKTILFPAESLMILTIKSADPVYPNRWITVPIKMDAALSSIDPVEIAAHLNRPLYDRNHTYYIGNYLNEAGFIRGRFAANPYLLGGVSYGATTPAIMAGDIGERQVLFVANDDQRHPAFGDPTHVDYSKVLLLCGGQGRGKMSSTKSTVNSIDEFEGTTDEFYNVLVEIAPNTASGFNLAQTLGNEFSNAFPETEVIRCGLFFTELTTSVTSSSDRLLTNIDPAWFNANSKNILASVNQQLFGTKRGHLSIDAYLGTHDFPQFNTSGAYPLSWVVTGLVGTSDKTSPFDDGFRNRIQTSQSGTGVRPNMGKWQQHRKRFVRPDFSLADSAGFYGAWISYTNQTVEAHEFSSAFIPTSDMRIDGFRNVSQVPFVYTFELPFQEPVWDRVSFRGDQAYISEGSLVANGIILNHQSGRRTSYRASIILQDFEGATTRSFRYKSFPQPFNPFDPYTPNSALSYSLEILPSNAAIENRYRTTMSVSSTRMTGRPTSVNRGAQSNITFVMGGHLELISNQGATNPAGISFGTFNNMSGFLTHMEQGVFILGGYGETDSEPFYTNLNNGVGDNIGATKGGGRGTNSKSSAPRRGVAGIRFSGDTQIWLENIHKLSSGGKYTAAIIGDSLIDDEPILGKGISSHLMAASGYARFGDALSESVIGSHAPFLVSGGQDADQGVFEQTNVLLGLTQKDYTAWSRMSIEGVVYGKPHKVFSEITSSFNIQTDREFSSALTLHDVSLIKNLKGKWLKLELPSGGEVPPYTYTQNEGTFQILAAPVISTFRNAVDTIHFSSLLDSQGQAQKTTDLGSNPKDFVAVLIVRVGRYVSPHSGFKATNIVRNPSAGTGGNGYSWEILETPTSPRPIYCAEVSETGGAPTGINKTISGLTINPKALGKSYLPFLLTQDEDASSENVANLEGKLFGVFSMSDSKGSPKSLAYFTSTNASNDFSYEKSWRGVIKSFYKTDLVERTFQNAFSVDEDGRVQYQQKQRLGLGVVIDGGLGVIHATGFRANPRPVKRDSLGAMSLFGSAAFPLTDFNGKTAAVHLPSVFDTSEFVDDLLVVGAKSAIIFEDSRGAEGLVARLKENAVARQLSPNNSHSTLSDIYPNDSVIPFNSGGIIFKGSGGVTYERTFNYLNANSTRPVGSFLGKPQTKGLRGLGVPNTGAYFLLPKGPSNLLGSGRGKANWNSGSYGAATTNVIPADSVPLYEFPQTFAAGKGAFGVGGFLNNVGGWVEPEFNDGSAPANHKATGGSAYQGYRHAESRGTSGPFTSATDIQVRLLEGMIVENTTNGTFYSLGETGRHWIESQYDAFLSHVGKTNPVGVGQRTSAQGSILFKAKNSPLESALFYDLNPYVGLKNTHSLDFCWGTGDRTDTFIDTDVSSAIVSPALTGVARCHVRNSLVGHNLRVTANVEFVPILGEHDVDGGLLPPMSGGSVPQIDGTMIEDADAVFYSFYHNFRKAGETYGAGDIGKFLYICGTECYQYTGWWVIIDVIENYIVQPSLATGVSAYSRDVAVVRKWKRNNDAEGNLTTGQGTLPLQPRSPILRTCSGTVNDNWFNRLDCSDLILGARNKVGTYIWQMTIPSADIQTNGTTVQDLVDWLNITAAYNGSTIFSSLKTAHPSVFIASRPNVDFIKWSLEGVNDSTGHLNTLVVSYDLGNLDEIEKNFLIGGISNFCASWQSDAASSFPIQTNQAWAQGGEVGRHGFFSRKGVNSSLDNGLGDRNNYMPMAYVNATLDIVAQSAARGLRWVFSHPLTEEHTGGYLHLDRPVKDHFDYDIAGFSSPTADGDANAPFWVSRYQTHLDVLAETLVKKTDIFRINRCPSTYNIIVGGDCEIYHREPLSSATNKGDTSMIYSPLSVDYNCLWVDTDQRIHPVINLYDASSAGYNITPMNRANRYSIQPVAREKIVAINPSSGESNVILDESAAMLIHQIEGVNDGSGSATAGIFRVVIKNPSVGTVGDYFPPQQSLSVGTPIIFRRCSGNPQLVGINNKVGYIVEVEALILNTASSTDPKDGSTVIKVYMPSMTIPIGIYVAATGIFSVSEGVRPYQVEGTDASQPWKLLAKEDLVIGSANTQKTQEMNYYDDGSIKRQWFPASRWWQVMNPITHYGYTYDPVSGSQIAVSMNNAENPNVLRIDLTESFTQAQQSGSGLGSPIREKTPRGARLNRIWVNFGLWGNPMSNPQTGAATSDRLATPAFVAQTGYEAGTKVQAMTFNLVLQIPSVKENKLHKNRSKSGAGSLPFNGRAPTTSKMQSDSTLVVSADEQTFGTMVIPLYINREAGDLSPNIHEKFASFGFAQKTAHSVYDWEDGDNDSGFGVGSSNSSRSYYEISHDGALKDFVSSSTTPVVWGGIDTRKFVKDDLSTGNVFNMLVSASLNPRSSILASNPMTEGGVRGESFGGDEFLSTGSTIARSIHPQAITGITIAHSATFPLPPREMDGTRQHSATGKADVQSINSAPHSFTVALTPVGGGSTSGGSYSYSGDHITPVTDKKGRYWNTLEDPSNGSIPNYFVGNWLEYAAEKMGFSSSMLPTGAKVYLEVTVPHTRRTYDATTFPRTSNGCWVGQVLCSFDVETADGTALSLNVNVLGED